MSNTTTPEKTPWFDRGTEPPMADRPGVYEAQDEFKFEGFSWFDGKHFRGLWGTAERAEEEKDFFGWMDGDTGVSVARWRGLTAPAGGQQ